MMRRLQVIFLLGLFCILLIVQNLNAHPDLEAQIELLTEQISKHPQNTELLIKRGDLYRRHGDWTAGERDFQTVRALTPGNLMIDWYEGRLFVAANRFEDADVLLTRFLENNPAHAGAYQARARARLALKQPVLAAEDFQSAIDESERPSPSLYRSRVLSLVAAGRTKTDVAIIAVNKGLVRFPGEVSLLGLGTDLSLAQSNPKQSVEYMSVVPARLKELPQWRFRTAVRVCVEGDLETADRLFTAVLEGPPDADRQKAGTWVPPFMIVNELLTVTSIKNCSEAAWEILRQQHP